MSISGNAVNPFEKGKGTVCVCILKLARMVQSFSNISHVPPRLSQNTASVCRFIFNSD